MKVISLPETEYYSQETALRQLSSEVIDFGDIFQEEVDTLLEVFYSWKIAVGLAAPQIGIQKRFAVINIDKTKPGETLIIVNPEIKSESGKKDKKLESCLSLANVRGEVERRDKVHFSYQDRFGVKKQLGVSGFLARVILHEVDHLNGILYVDRMLPHIKLQPLEIDWR